MRQSVMTMLGCAALLALLAASADTAQARKLRRQATKPTTMAATPFQRGANLFPPGPVYYGREYLGNDPDPRIRLQIQRDLGAHFGGAD
jgi:hypothetical protein